MTRSAGFVLRAIVFSASAAACDPDGQTPPWSEGEPLGEASQAQCGGYIVANVVPREGMINLVAPQHLIDATEGWGPQTLFLSVDRQVEPRLSIERVPGVEIEKKKLTKSLHDAVGFSIAHGLELTASSSTPVEEGSYKRLEAYPSFQMLTWDLWQDACGPFGATRIASGTVYRPVGVYFRVVVLVKSPRKHENGSNRNNVPGAISPVVAAEAAGIQ